MIGYAIDSPSVCASGSSPCATRQSRRSAASTRARKSSSPVTYVWTGAFAFALRRLEAGGVCSGVPVPVVREDGGGGTPGAEEGAATASSASGSGSAPTEAEELI